MAQGDADDEQRRAALYAAQHDPETRTALLAATRAQAEQEDRWYQEDREDDRRIAAYSRSVRQERLQARALEERR
jgi:hypothetical protein